VIDRRTETAEKCHPHRLRPGTDAALALGLIRADPQ
jgi:anaerobic selenocysteine-containing dehydrogenase